MHRTIGILIILGFGLSIPVHAETVLAGLDDNTIQNAPDWQREMIKEHSFEIEMSEFHYPVWFVSYMPVGEDNDVSLKIIQQGDVLDELDSYIPDAVGDRVFSSLDAVSFLDYNQDGNTDIFIVKTWEDLTVSAVYDGNDNNDDHYFVLNRELSDCMTVDLSEHTISNMTEYAQNIGIQKYNAFSDDIPAHFGFASGVGAWGSSIDLYCDGTFDGHFWDTDMGGSGDGFDSTASHCECHGRFGNIRRYGDYYYSMTLEEYSTEQEVGTMWISEETDGAFPFRLMNIITNPRGIYPGTVYYIFLPGAPVDELPVDISQSMLGAYGVGVTETEPKTVLNWVLYNADQGAPFTGYN